MNTQTLVTWPTGNFYPDEVWRVRQVKNGGRDIVIQNRDGYKATVSVLTVEVVNA
jgi:hypothetical protein